MIQEVAWVKCYISYSAVSVKMNQIYLSHIYHYLRIVLWKDFSFYVDLISNIVRMGNDSFWLFYQKALGGFVISFIWTSCKYYSFYFDIICQSIWEKSKITKTAISMKRLYSETTILSGLKMHKDNHWVVLLRISIRLCGSVISARHWFTQPLMKQFS